MFKTSSVVLSAVIAFGVTFTDPGAVLAAVPSPQTQTLTPLAEKIEVSIINLDVTVTDHGKPVTDLTSDDFEVFEDGKRQAITNFYAVTGPAATQAGTEVVIPAEQYRRKVLVLVDNAHTSMHDRNEALMHLEQFIDEHFDGDYEWSIATIDNRMHLLLPMTRDKAAIHTAILSLRRSATSSASGDWVFPVRTALNDIPAPDHDRLTHWMGETELAERQRFADSTAGVIANSVRAFGAIEGRKLVLLVTGHLALDQLSPVRMTTGNRGIHTLRVASVNGRLVNLRDLLISEANASNTSIYIIGTEGSTLKPSSSMYWLARMTGGKYLTSNYIGESLSDFDDLSSNFYSIGYREQHDEDGRYRRIRVRVKGHSSYRLQFRTGHASMTDEEQLGRTLRSFLGATFQKTTLPIATVLDAPQYENKRAVVALHVSIPMDRIEYLPEADGSRGRVNLYISVFDDEGHNLGLYKIDQDVRVDPNEQTTQRRIVLNVPNVAMDKGRSYRIVIAVRDEITEAIGITINDLSV